ncbi:MAG TPA: class I SAM-dependent methyltransferase [Pyrinomonadaceae bacterium]|nr:class I SAM-dependent methyltransferase [Pyrinomonadaceae bacterium]
MTIRITLLVFIALIALVLSGCANSDKAQSAPPATPPTSPAAASPTGTPKVAGVEIVDQPLDVPYVPTPDEVVARMLIMAGVNKKDFLYDLGSGDGRIVITAAKKYGARGVGYDLNPKRIEESNDNARKAGVTNMVRFVKKDLFEADLTGATVVTLYLLPDVNLKLRPKLLKDLRPGTRIVSHNYDMGDWKAEAYEEITVRGTKHYVYRWTVPEPDKAPK